MARSRSLPSTLFEDPNFFELSSDAQVILVGLVLIADDHGRGLAHTGLLARKLNKTPCLIEETLTLLERQQLLVCYRDDRQHYYALTRWQEWETLSKPARSKYPDPPSPTPSQESFHFPNFPQNPQGNLGESRETLIEGEEEREEEGEGEEEGENTFAGITFLTPASDGTVTTASFEQVREATRRVAKILKLSMNTALLRVVSEYITDPHLSLLGEADAAREWIDDSRRNRKHTRMTPAFFRRWLRREQEDHHRRHNEQAWSTGTGDKVRPDPSAPSPSPSLSPARRNLMDLGAQYQAEYNRGKEHNHEINHQSD